MDAEKFLKQIRTLDNRIWNTQKEIEMWKNKAEYGGIDYGRERVKSSGSKSRVEDMICKALGLQEQLEKDIKLRRSIIDALNRLSDVHIDGYSVLYEIFILGHSYKEIAVKNEKSLSWVRDNRASGLRELERILENGR